MRKGLKQGCPLSRLLFILVVDTLDAFIKVAIVEGFLEGVSDVRKKWSLTNLHFADATLLFVSVSQDQAIILKIILYCFELLSGLKINFGKSSLIYLDLE